MRCGIIRMCLEREDNRVIKAKFISAEEAAYLLKDGKTVCTIGMTLCGACESILKAIEKRFLSYAAPKDLTLLHAGGQSDRERGIQHFAHEGMVKRIVGAHWGLAPMWMELISQNRVEAYCLPQGQITHLFRSMACGLPGKLSKVGIGTFIDPRIEGGKMNERTKPLPNIVDLIELKGEEYLFYNKIPIDYCLIRGTICDESGNLNTDDEAMKLELLPAVLATKANGGIVIAQVREVAANGTLNPKSITVPGVFIDAIVICDNPEEDHRQTSSWYYKPSYAGKLRVPESQIELAPFNERKLIARRAIKELKEGDIINLGTGIPNDMIGKVCVEEGLADDITITVESGIYGGIQAGGIDFGIGQNLSAMIAHHEQMDFYNGRGVDVTFMGAGELDQYGNVNATKMGGRCTGAGGFIDITQNAHKIVFCSTFTTKGTEYNFSNGMLEIVREGSVRKMVSEVKQISFNGQIAREKRQKVLFITERGVFELVEEGVMLTEIAPGINLQEDILEKMDFKPIISREIKEMDRKLFIP